jgi:hypothetical protein
MKDWCIVTPQWISGLSNLHWWNGCPLLTAPTPVEWTLLHV